MHKIMQCAGHIYHLHPSNVCKKKHNFHSRLKYISMTAETEMLIKVEYFHLTVTVMIYSSDSSLASLTGTC